MKHPRLKFKRIDLYSSAKLRCQWEVRLWGKAAGGKIDVTQYISADTRDNALIVAGSHLAALRDALFVDVNFKVSVRPLRLKLEKETKTKVGRFTAK